MMISFDGFKASILDIQSDIREPSSLLTGWLNLNLSPDSIIAVLHSRQYSVLIEYDPQSMKAPIITAKEHDPSSFIIAKTASKKGIPVIESRVLATELYYSVNLGEMIPEKFWSAVSRLFKKPVTSIFHPPAPTAPILMELGIDLLYLVNKENIAVLRDRLQLLSKELSEELGFALPMIRILENSDLKPSNYCVKINQLPMFSNVLIQVAEIPESGVTESIEVMCTHLKKAIRAQASKLLSWGEVTILLDELEEKRPYLMDRIRKELLIADIEKVLVGLLKEGKSIKNLDVILEAMMDFGFEASE